MQKVKYSVIIPVYNAENTLRACINSILTQNYSDFELILVNDGSTDSSLKISLEYEQNYNNVFVVDKPNGGVSSARNAGLKIAKGEYILFVDSDDEVLPEYFLSLDKCENEDFLVFGFDEIDEFRKFTRFPKSEYLSGAEYITESRDCGPCNKRYKRKIVSDNKIDFPEDISIGEDFVFCFKYSLFCQTVSFLKESLYLYNHITPGSLTRTQRDICTFCKKILLMYGYAFESLEAADINETLRNELIRNLDYNYCRTAFASAMQPVIYKSKTLREDYKHIADIFYEGYRHNVKPKSIVHFVTRFCVKKKLRFVFYIVAVLKHAI